MLFGAGTYNHYKNETNKTVDATDKTKRGFLESVHNLTVQDVTVGGTIEVIGLSNIPSTAEVYVETTKVRFSDGKEISVINTSEPAVADDHGSTSGFNGSGDLHLI